MLKVVGEESAQGEAYGRSVLDEIAREGARRMLLAALETETWKLTAPTATPTATPWSSATGRAAPERSRSEPGRSRERPSSERPARRPRRGATPIHKPHPAAVHAA